MLNDPLLLRWHLAKATLRCLRRCIVHLDRRWLERKWLRGNGRLGLSFYEARARSSEAFFSGGGTVGGLREAGGFHSVGREGGGHGPEAGRVGCGLGAELSEVEVGAGAVADVHGLA